MTGFELLLKDVYVYINAWCEYVYEIGTLKKIEV